MDVVSIALGVLVIAGRRSLVRVILDQRGAATSTRARTERAAEVLAIIVGGFMITVGALILAGMVHRG